MKRMLILSIVLAGIPAVTAHADDVIDPSDLTRVYTQAALFTTSDADVRASAMFTGAWSDRIQFAGFAEGVFGNDKAKAAGEDKFGGDYQRGRAQYFQAHETGISAIPRLGLTFDLIHRNGKRGTDDDLLFSFGALGLISPRYTLGAMVFPNVAYTTGEVMGKTANGYMLNLFATFPVGDTGAFIQAWPEYIDVAGDVVEMESLSFNFMLNAPVTTGRNWWLMTKLEYGWTDVVQPDGTAIDGDVGLRAEIGVKWFM